MRLARFFLFWSFVTLLLSAPCGCGISQQIRYVSEEKHRSACGPESIHEVLQLYGQDISTRELSGSIRYYANPLERIGRFGAALFDIKGYKITFPEEIQKELDRRGFAVVQFKGSHDLVKRMTDFLSEQDETGILLTQDGDDALRWHYESFPPRQNAGTLYGDKAIYRAVFWISAKNGSKPDIDLIKTATQELIDENTNQNEINNKSATTQPTTKGSATQPANK